MPIYQLSQLASGAIPTPSFTSTPFEKDWYKTLNQYQQDQSQKNDQQAVAGLAGQAKLMEGYDKVKPLHNTLIDLQSKKESLISSAKEAELKRDEIEKAKAEMQQIRYTLSQPNIDFMERASLMSRYNELASNVAKFEQSTDFGKMSSDINDLDKKIEETQNTIQSQVSPYVISAAKTIADPGNLTVASKNKDYTLMGQLRQAIDLKYQERARLLASGKSVNDPEVQTIDASIAELNNKYNNASVGEQYNSKFAGEAKTQSEIELNKAQATKATFEVKELSDKSNQDITKDIEEQITKWTTTNRKTIDGLNLAYGFVRAFDKLKNAEDSPAQFAALVKAVNKLIEPTAAVMADDMKTMASYGGGEQTTVQVALTNFSALADAAKSFKQSTENAIKSVGSKIKGLIPGQENSEKTEGSDNSGSQGFNLDKAVAASKQAIVTQYQSQVPQIVATGEKFKSIVVDQIKNVQDTMKKVINNSIDYAQFRHANVVQLVNGNTTTVSDLLQTKSGKGAFESIVNSNLDSLFSSINNTDHSLVSSALAEAEAEYGSQSSKGDQTAQTAPKPLTPEEQKRTAPIGVRGTKDGETRQATNSQGVQKTFVWDAAYDGWKVQKNPDQVKMEQKLNAEKAARASKPAVKVSTPVNKKQASPAKSNKDPLGLGL